MKTNKVQGQFSQRNTIAFGLTTKKPNVQNDSFSANDKKQRTRNKTPTISYKG